MLFSAWLPRQYHLKRTLSQNEFDHNDENIQKNQGNWKGENTWKHEKGWQEKSRTSHDGLYGINEIDNLGLRSWLLAESLEILIPGPAN